MSSLSKEQKRQIRELIVQDLKIAAIARYRELTNTSLREAKAAVEAIARGAAVSAPAPAQVGEPDAFLENRIKRLLSERKKIEAVKIYRKAYNCGLKEAKNAVDLIQAEIRREGYSSMLSTPAFSDDPFAEDTQRNRNCLALVLAISLVAIGGLVFFFFMRSGF